MMTVREAWLVAKTAHAGQMRRNGDDYFEAHVMEVATSVRASHELQRGHPNDSPLPADEEQDLLGNRLIVAYLHDVVEDSEVTLDDLHQMGLHPVLREAVDAITKREGEDYFEYIQRVAANPLARFVKTLDIRHNLGDEPTLRQMERYLWALVELTPGG